MAEVGDENLVMVLAHGGGFQELFVKPGETCAVDSLKAGGLVGQADDGLVLAGGDFGEGYTRLVHEDDDLRMCGCG